MIVTYSPVSVKRFVALDALMQYRSYNVPAFAI